MTLTRKLLTAAALLAFTAGCGGGTEEPENEARAAEPDAEAPAEPDADADTDAEPQGVAVSGLELGTTSLGTIITTPDARSIYLFDPDQQGESTCVDACAENWPPVLLSGDAPQAGDGVDADLLATTQRPDGGVQLTYDGWPLYLWIGDQDAGDVLGQGAADAWWVLEADGTPVRDASDTSEGADPPDDEQDDGYGY